MELVKLHRNGKSQTLTLPEGFSFPEDEVDDMSDESEYIFSHPATVREIPEADTWASMRKGLTMFTDDFLADFEERKPNNADN
ncbi:MAG: hypothetical protein IJR63_08105 [Synergistaceae bacterium]|nr:hypothetical protein [Synergistaceae bacterium]